MNNQDRTQHDWLSYDHLAAQGQDPCLAFVKEFESVLNNSPHALEITSDQREKIRSLHSSFLAIRLSDSTVVNGESFFISFREENRKLMSRWLFRLLELKAKSEGVPWEDY